MREVSGGPSLTGWVGGVAEGLPLAQTAGRGGALCPARCSAPLVALPHPPICTLICLPNRSVPSCFGFNKYFDGVWAGYWDCAGSKSRDGRGQSCWENTPCLLPFSLPLFGFIPLEPHSHKER